MSRHAVRVFSFLLLGLLLFSAPAARAQRSERGLSVPTPESVLGFRPGDDRRLADWREITDYFTRLDRASDRVAIETLGQTTLGRPLIAAFLSSPENIRDLAKYKEIARKLADPRLVAAPAERDRLVREGKTVVVISCSIHSTEIVASQMSMRLAYELAAGADAETRETLAETILILIPSANPDGVDIVADWYRRTLGTPFEGTEPPELYHHYAGHDNNRDWFMLNLRETQLLTRLFWREWFPQIVYDVHQQGQTGSRLFVPPFYDPPNPHIAPLLLREVGLLGHQIAADLQAAGYRGVITNAMYDTWWHGGFRTAPYYHNSVGILSEAASARLMTPVNITERQLRETSTRGMPDALRAATNFPDPWPGGLWRPRDILEMELRAARSVLTHAARYRARYLQNFFDLGRRAVAPQADSGDPLAYLLMVTEGRERAVRRLTAALTAQGVEVHRLEKELHVETERDRETVAPAGSYLILLAQPYRANVLALFERQRYPERRTAGGAAEHPYDVAGWTLPWQMGVDARAVRAIREGPAERGLTLLRDEGRSLDETRRPPASQTARTALYRGWTNSMDEGWTRWVFDTFRIPYQTLRDNDVRAGNLRARFETIILPSQREKEIVEGRAAGSYPAEYTGGITEAGVANLRAFVEAGGTLICFDASTELAIKRFALPVRNALENLASADFYCPGSILRLEVDTHHPLARGLGREVNAYFIHSRAFETAETGGRVRVVARYADRDVLQSGWLLGENYLRGRAALVEVGMGRGRVILFGFRPQHRGQTWATFPFIFNALGGGAETVPAG